MTGLPKTVLPIQLGQGLDTKTDPKTVAPGRLLVLENCVFQTKNQLRKRNGHDALSNKTVAGAELPEGNALEIFNEELLQYANQTLYSYSAGADRWVSKGSAVSAIVRTRQIVKNTASQTQADSAYNNGVSVFAWEDSRGGIRSTVIDEVSGASLLTDVELHATATRARCLAFGSYLYVFYTASGNLYVRRINPAAPTAFESAVTVSTTVNTSDPTYDVYAYQNLRILWAHNVQGASEIRAGWLDDSPAVLTGTLAAVTISGAGTVLSVNLGPSNTIYVTFYNGTDLKCGIYNNGLGQLHAPFTVESSPGTVKNITAYKLTDNTGIQVLYGISNASTHKYRVRQNSVLAGGTAGTAASFLRSVGLASKAWTYTDEDGNENHYVGIVHDSTLQATFFVARHDGLVIAKQQATLAGGLTTRPILPNVWSANDEVFAYAILNKTQLISENSTIFTPNGVAKTSVDFTNQDSFTAAQLGNNLHIVGGILSMYDGQSVVEHGFHLYPENLSGSDSATGGSMSDGTYQYVAVYEWTDNFGQLHQSAPSVPLSVVVNGGGSSQSVTVTVPTLRLTAKAGDRTNVSIAVYRTENGGELFYRATSLTSPTYNSTTADSVDFVDTLTDAALVSRQILYTAGGVLEHFAPPASSAICVYKNRIVLGGLEDPNEIWLSKELKKGEPIAFSDEITKTVEPTGGDVSTVFVIDDKLIVSKPDHYFYIAGDGPNNTGLEGGFSEPTFVTADVGFTNAQSLVRTPDGVMGSTGKGLYVIDSSLTPFYIGAAVEAFNGLMITSANLIPDTNQVRFTTSAGAALVYDYEEKQWSTFTAHEAKDAVVWQGRFVMLKRNGAIWKENPSIFKDAGAAIRRRIGTGWLALASVVGLQRVYRVALLGEYKSPHKLRVRVGYDFSPAYSDAIPFNPDTSLEISRFGDGATYGADATYGGPNNSYRVSAHLRIQKCQAIRFLIEEEITGATEGSQEAFSISALGLLVGVKQGMGKFKSSQNLGTTG